MQDFGKPSKCEADCPIFRNLPLFKAIGDRLDPLVGTPTHAMRSVIGYVIDQQHPAESSAASHISQPLRFHRRRLVSILAKLIGR